MHPQPKDAQHLTVLTEKLTAMRDQPRPFCRDCADEDGLCPTSRLPCDMFTILTDAIAAIEMMKAELWVSVEDALPTEPGLYLTVCFGGGKWVFDTVRYDHLKWHAPHSNLIEAWMPIPEYKGEKR